jgi:hypothetical protein
MSIRISTTSMFGIGLQTAYDTPQVTNANFRYFPFTAMPYGVNQPSQQLPQEAGATIVPRGSFKTGVWGQGQVNLIPRLVDDIGFILVAALGLDTPRTGKVLSAGTGIAISTIAKEVTGNEIQITTATAHGLVTGDTVFVRGVLGANAADANGRWVVEMIDTTNIVLTGSSHNASMTETAGYVYPDLVTQLGSNVHEFTYDVDEASIPYFTTRRVLEGTTKLGEQIQDNRIGSVELNLPAVGPMTASMSMIGRVPSALDLYVPDATTTWALAALSNSYDNDAGFALSVDPKSSVKLDGVALPCTGLSIAINNQLLSADSARVVGSQTPIDYPVQGRSISVQCTSFLQDYDFYRDLVAGGHQVTDTKWTTTVKRGDIDFRVYSPLTFAATGATPQHALQLLTEAANVEWSVSGPLNVTPGQPMQLQLTGTLQSTNNSAKKYALLRVQNAISGAYVHP